MNPTKEIVSIELTLRKIFDKKVINRFDIAVSNKLFDKWKNLTKHKEDKQSPILEDFIEKEPNWKIYKNN
jgi:hypothetical protein